MRIVYLHLTSTRDARTLNRRTASIRTHYGREVVIVVVRDRRRWLRREWREEQEASA